MNCAGSSSRDFVRRDLDAELVAHPAAGRPHAEVRLQIAGARRQVDPRDRLVGLLDQLFGQLVAADLLQVAVAEVEAPAGVGQLGQRLPVPFALRLRPRAGSLRSRRAPATRPCGWPRRWRCRSASSKSTPRKSRGVELHVQQLAGRGGERFACRSPGRGTASRCSSTCSVDHLGDQVAAVDAVENPLAVAVDALPLLVHHLVVFEQVLADLEVALFDLLLGAFDAAARPSGSRSPRLPACPAGSSTFLTHSPAKIRIRSSSSDR